MIILGHHDYTTGEYKIVFFSGEYLMFFFRTSILIALGDLIPASPETITSDSAAQLTGGDPWIDGLEGFFVLKSLWIQETPWILVFKILNFVWGFVCSSSVQVLYIYVISRISGFGMVPSMAKKTVLESNNRSCITVSLNYHQ